MRTWFLLGAVLAAAIAVSTAAAFGPLGGAEKDSDEASEPRLDELTAAELSDVRRSQAGGRATAVPPARARGAAGRMSADEEAPPERVLRENAVLRRELDHLRALEAEQRRVSGLLAGAGGFGPLRLGPGGLVWPVNGAFTSPFGQRWGRLHAGVDIAAPEGTPIRAAAAGRVVIAGWVGGYGNYTCIQHTRTLSTCYAHQSRLGTRRGATVAQGQVMGFVGNTGHSFGAHLHFETRLGGRPVDPMTYF